MNKKRTIRNKNRIPPIIIFAIASLFITPVITSFLVPPDSQLPITVSAYLTFFWIVITCGWIWWTITDIYRERKSKQQAIEASIRGEDKTIKTKYGMVADLKLLQPSRHEELMMALSYAGEGDKQALKKMSSRAFWTVLKYATWISVLLLLIPFVALRHIHHSIIIGWILLIFIHIPYSYIRDLLRNDENCYEAAAMGLILSKSNQTATGIRYGRKVTVSFSKFGSETRVSGSIGTFNVQLSDVQLSKKELPETVQAIFKKLITKKYAKLWKRAKIKSNGKEILIVRKYRTTENNFESGYWICDIWLAEWLASGKPFEG